jgi:hypothetical protein
MFDGGHPSTGIGRSDRRLPRDHERRSAPRWSRSRTGIACNDRCGDQHDIRHYRRGASGRDARPVLAAKDIPSSSPTRAARNPRRTRRRDRATRHAYVGFPSFTARFRAEQEGLQRVELTRSASSQRMTVICAFETFERRLESTLSGHCGKPPVEGRRLDACPGCSRLDRTGRVCAARRQVTAAGLRPSPAHSLRFPFVK